MNVKITPTRLAGTLDAIASKSYAHRVIIASALAKDKTKIFLNTTSEDIEATVSCIKSLGAEIKKGAGYIEVLPNAKNKSGDVVLDCCESGSTARFLLPVAAVMTDKFKMIGRGRLPERPMKPLTDQMALHGVKTDSDKIPLTACGTLTGGEYSLAANISSQYISGLLFALAKTEEKSVIKLTTELESGAYVDMTIDVLEKFGVNVKKGEACYITEPAEYISPKEITVEGDWSNAAFWVCADKICENVRVNGLNDKSIQSDRRVLDVIGDDIIDAREIPDLVPILSVYACFKKGRTQIINAGRLRIKESDRIKTTKESLSSLGADIEETEDGLIINGTGSLKGGVCCGFGDHRIVMSCAIASCICENEVTITGAEAVNKSYPTFFEDFKALGGIVTEV